MWDFSGDEFVCLIVATVIAVYAASRFPFSLVMMQPARRGARIRRWVLAVAFVSCLGINYLTLQHWADPVHVAGHADYIFLYMICGIVWMVGAISLMRLAGCNARDDALERDNSAAVAVTVGVMLGFTLIFAGANVGYGATIWTTLVPAFMASVALLLLWIIAELLTGAAEAVTIDRDLASGLRVAAFLISSGAILGRAVAGDWNGWDGLWNDMIRLGCPVLGLFILFVVSHGFLKPTPTRAIPSLLKNGFIPFMLFAAIAAACLIHSWPPKVAPVATHHDGAGGRP